MNARDVADKIKEKAVELGFKWKYNAGVETGYLRTMTRSCYLDLTYTSGRRYDRVEIRVSDHPFSESRAMKDFHRGVIEIDTSSPNVASSIERAMRALDDAKARCD